MIKRGGINAGLFISTCDSHERPGGTVEYTGPYPGRACPEGAPVNNRDSAAAAYEKIYQRMIRARLEYFKHGGFIRRLVFRYWYWRLAR